MYFVKTLIAAIVICFIIYLTGLVPQSWIHLDLVDSLIDYSVSLKIRYILILISSYILYKYLST